MNRSRRTFFRVFWIIMGTLLLYTGLQAGRLAPGASAWVVWGATFLWFALMIGWQFPYRSGAWPVQSPKLRTLAWAGSIAVGVWATFIVLSLAEEPLRLLRIARPGDALSLVAIAAGLAVVGLGQAVSGPSVREIEVPIEGLPKALTGLRIAHFTDLHVGPTIQRGYVQRVADLLKAARPDLIAFTGDLADGPVESLRPFLAPLKDLRAPLGVYFVTGNHEYYWGAERWLEEARRLGFTPLVDENRLVTREGAVVLVAGVPDRSAPAFLPDHRSDPGRAVRSDRPSDFKLLLAHRPDSCLEGEKAGFQLQLSGHTHGGQFFPFSLLIRLFHKYARGLHRHGRMWLYVNPGTGYWGPPHRFRVPSEITVLTLLSA
jgi:predicted MPP superfamily phosphohydrolase